MPIPASSTTADAILITIMVGIITSVVAGILLEILKVLLIQNPTTGSPQPRIKVVPSGIAIGILCAFLYALIRFPSSSTPTDTANLPQPSPTSVTPVSTVPPYFPSTEKGALAVLIRNAEERKLATAHRLIGSSSRWVVGTRSGNGEFITFYYPGYGQFDYSGPRVNDERCTSTPFQYIITRGEGWHFACAPYEFPMPFTLDEVTWYR